MSRRRRLGKVAAVAFDKTGTLPIGKPTLVSMAPATGVTEAELLTTAAAAESLSQHPIAIAILLAVKERGLVVAAASGFEAVHGKGLRAVVEGDVVLVGNLAMFGDDPLPNGVRADLERLELETTMVVQRRPEAKETIAALRRLGISRAVLLSGDNERVAQAIGAQVGVDDARGPLMPEGKVAALKELSAAGGVAVVGDGVNDAPALAAASVGVSMGGAGSDVALETADVVLMSNDLRRLPFAVGLARKATSIIRQNLIVSLGVSIVLVVATLFGYVSIAEAVVFHEGSTLLVIANAFRLLGYRE